jgi:hypothetical protein
MSYLKTKENDDDVIAFLNSIEDPVKKEDCLKIMAMLKDITGHEAKMWGKRMVGYGSYTYKTKAGKVGEWFLIGFAPAKANISLHLMFGLGDETELLEKLGNYKMGKGCLYIKSLGDVDQSILKDLMKNTYEGMKKSML